MKTKPKPPRSVRRESSAKLDRAALAARDHIAQAVDSLLKEFVGNDSALKFGKAPNIGGQSALHESYNRLRAAAKALNIWHSHEIYVSADGSPKALRKKGEISLESLTKFLVADVENADQLVADLIDFDLISRKGLYYRPKKRAAVVGEPSALILAHAAAAIARLINTVSHNVSGGAPPRYERHVADVRIPLTDLPVFLRFVEEQGQYLIDAVDDWLSKREIKDSRRVKEVAVGIGAFAWVDAPKSSISQRSSQGSAIAPRK